MRVIKTQNAVRKDKKFASPTSSKHNNNDLSMASESLENVFKSNPVVDGYGGRRESAPDAKYSNNMNRSNNQMPSLQKKD